VGADAYVWGRIFGGGMGFRGAGTPGWHLHLCHTLLEISNSSDQKFIINYLQAELAEKQRASFLRLTLVDYIREGLQ
jgi:hypothetical protein